MSDEKKTPGGPPQKPEDRRTAAGGDTPHPMPPQEMATLPRAELDGLRGKVDEYLRMAQRVQADFSNYQKRVARDRDQESRFLVERMLLDLLPALDTFDLAVRQAPREAGAFVKGMELAEREIFRKLELHGLKRIPAGGTFSPAVHEAIMQVEAADKAAGEIVAELRPGYMLYEKVLRPAQVSVAVKKP